MLVLDEVQKLRDEALIERLTLSVRNDRRLAVRLLVEMGEVQERGLYRDLGFSSMFVFATRKLGMSEGEAALRIRAAKVGRSFPIALELLGRCEVNLTTLSLLASVLTPESIHLLHAARFKSKSEVQALIAAHAPKPDAPDSVRRLPPPRANARARHAASTPTTPTTPTRLLGTAEQLPPSPSPRDVHTSTNLVGSMVAAQGALLLEAQRPSPQRTAAEVVQLSAERHKISFTGSQRVRDLLQEAQDLRRHRYPAGDLEPLFERALELLVAEEQKRRFALTVKPRTHRAKSSRRTRSRHIPHAVQRKVWARDAGECRFVGTDGQRCQTRSWLQLHHVVPFERGGPSSADNLLLLCQPHNALCAERDYGRAFIERRIARGSSGNGARAIPVGHSEVLGPPQSAGP